MKKILSISLILGILVIVGCQSRDLQGTLFENDKNCKKTTRTVQNFIEENGNSTFTDEFKDETEELLSEIDFKKCNEQYTTLKDFYNQVSERPNIEDEENDPDSPVDNPEIDDENGEETPVENPLEGDNGDITEVDLISTVTQQLEALNCEEYDHPNGINFVTLFTSTQNYTYEYFLTVYQELERLQDETENCMILFEGRVSTGEERDSKNMASTGFLCELNEVMLFPERPNWETPNKKIKCQPNHPDIIEWGIINSDIDYISVDMYENSENLNFSGAYQNRLPNHIKHQFVFTDGVYEVKIAHKDFAEPNWGF